MAGDFGQDVSSIVVMLQFLYHICCIFACITMPCKVYCCGVFHETRCDRHEGGMICLMDSRAK